MRGQAIHKSKWGKGFTIVEILVVVTVIGVLASIVMVSYNQAQIKAENAKTLQAVNQYLKALTTYAVQNGAYPVTSTYPCLGTQTTCGKMSGSSTCFTIGVLNYNAAFATTMLEIVSPLPEPSTQTISCSGNTYMGAYYNKNNTSGGKAASVYYLLRGNQPCVTKYGTVTASVLDDMTRCAVALPTLPS